MFTDIDIGIVLGVLGFAISIGLFFVNTYAKVIADETSTDRTNLLARLEGKGGWLAAYELWLRNLLDGLDRFFEQMKQTSPQPRYLTARSFDRHAFLALAYPFASAILSWFVFGEAGALGAAIDLTPEPSALVRVGWGVFVFIFAGVSITLLSKNRWLLAILVLSITGLPDLLGTPTPKAVVVALLLPYFLVLARQFNVGVTGGFAIAFAVVFAIAYGFEDTILGASFPDVESAVAIVVPMAVGLAAAIAFGFISNRTLARTNRPHLHWWVMAPLIILAGITAFIPIYMGFFEQELFRPALLIGLVLLPIVNVVFDFFSVGLTRFCLRRGLDPAERHLPVRAGWALLDLAGALVFMVGLCITMVFVLEGFNAAALAGGFTEAPVPVGVQIAEIATDGIQGKHFWLVFALFSTLLPTLLHLLIFLSSLFANWLGTNGRNLRLAEAIRDPQTLEGGFHAQKLAARVTLQWPLAIIATGLAGWCAFHGVLQIPNLGSGFLGLMEWSQVAAQSVFSR